MDDPDATERSESVCFDNTHVCRRQILVDGWTEERPNETHSAIALPSEDDDRRRQISTLE